MTSRRLFVTLFVALLLSAATSPLVAATCAAECPCPMMGAMMMKAARDAAGTDGALMPFMACCQRAPSPAVAPAPSVVAAPEVAVAAPAESPLADEELAAVLARPLGSVPDGLDPARRSQGVGLCVLNSVFRI